MLIFGAYVLFECAPPTPLVCDNVGTVIPVILITLCLRTRQQAGNRGISSAH